MSLILEALRKSEAERRRGATPDVAMELPPAPAARTRGLPAWLMPMLVVAAAAILATLWWSRRDAAPAAPPEPGPANVELEPAPAAPAIVARPQPQPSAPPLIEAAPSAPPPAPAPAIAAPAPSPPQPARTVAAPVPAPAPADGVVDIDATALPPVKLSMHMWDASPTRRFVILDGQRMAEGDRNGELTVIAIERDGVVVERDGQRARVPLP